MKNNKQKKHMISGKTKEEKRRLLLSRKYEHQNARIAKYGTDSVTAVAKDVNHRFIAALLAFVFALSCLVVGVNFATSAGTLDSDGFDMMESEETNGLVTRKGIRYNKDADGNVTSYDLRMEAYATKELATKTLNAKTPLDVVMVVDQGTSMTKKDILTGEGYQEVDSSSFTISDIDDNEYYYYDKDDEEWHRVSTDIIDGIEENYVAVSDVSSWTAQSANDWYYNHNRRNLYYLNEEDNVFETVYTSAVDWYKNAGELSASNFAGALKWDYYTNNSTLSNNYYYNSSGDINTYTPNWHRVYDNTHGVFGSGYYVYLWYYRDGETTFADGSSIEADYHDTSNWSKAYRDALSDGTIVRVPNDKYYTYKSYGPYDAFYKSVGSGSQAYKGGQLFTRQTNTSVLNKIWTSTDDSSVENKTEIHMLAWPLSGSTNTCPGSSSYSKTSLYTAGYRPYYTNNAGTRVWIGKAVYTQSKDSYILSEQSNIPLYEKETITRLQASQLAATEIAEQLSGITTDDVDHRIAIVGTSASGDVKTNLVSVTANDVDPANSVNDTIDDAIDSLTALGTSSLEAELTDAASVFSADDTTRKRVVIVFTDADSVSANELSAAAVLKDTYNADVYTVRVNSSTADSTITSYFSHLSSEYFATATNPIVETRNTDGLTYAYYGTDKSSLLTGTENAVASLFSQLETERAITTTLSMANSVLKDIISGNFDVPANPTITVQTATSSYNDDKLEWTNDDSLDDAIDHDWDAQNKTLSITGFDYNANYVTEEHSGKKIIVTISGLTLKDGVDVDSDRRIYSNTTASGLYKTGAEDLLFAAFPRPYVDKTSNLVPKGTSGEPGEGVVVNKYLTANENGNYDLTMEAYATSMTEAVTTVEKIPTDFVLVVDQSGSMDTRDMPVGNPTVQNNKNLEEIATGNYYYKDGDQYYRVYGVRDYLYRYYPANHFYTGTLKDYIGANLSWFMRENEINSIDNALYFRETINGKNYYNPLKITIQGVALTYLTRFQYTSKITGGIVKFNRDDTTYSTNGKSPWYHNVLNGDVMTSGALWSAANWFVQTGWPDNDTYTFSEVNLGLVHPQTGMYINYPMYGRHLGYTKLCYRDVNGVEHEVPSNYNNQTTWEYCDDDGNARSAQTADSARPTYSGLYKFPQNIDRLTALKAALNEFAQAVAQETDDFGKVDNKVSIVGFSSTSSSTTHDPDSRINRNYNNTELLTHTGLSVSGTNGWQKSTCDSNASEYYGKALVDSASEGQGENAVVNPKITQAIDALTHNGGTQPEDGLNMAYKVLTNRSNTTYTIRSGDHKGDPIERNTVVIFFTDGQPGNYHESDQYSEANEVVQEAKRIKDYNDTSLFSIGVFGESDGNPLTYSANNDWTTGTDGNRTQVKNLPKAQWKYLGGWMETYDDEYCLRRQWRPGNANYTETANDTIYDYMSVTSSNYPDAENFIAPEWLNGTFPSDNYVDATDGVDGNTVRHKSSAEATNKYYRMASSQDTLVEAFLQAITMTNHQIESDGTLSASTILRDILENDTFEMTSSTNYTIETDKGTADSNGVVTFDNNKTTIDLGMPPSLGTDRIEVSGFDYNTNSIFYGKAKDDANGLAKNEGRKLIVTLTNVVPKKTITSSGSNDNLLYSNETESGLWKNKLRAAFPTPAITRHSYTLNVDGDNKAATFDVTTTLDAGSTGSSDLSDVILVAPDGTRTPYNEISEVTFTNMADGQTFYFENVPPGYSVKTSLKAPDSFYTYTYWENSDDSNPVTLSMTEPTESTLNYSDNVLHVNSVSSYRTVTIAESVSGDYANTRDVFSVNVTLTPPTRDPYNENTIKIADDVTLNKELIGNSYKATIDNLPGDQNEKELRIPAGWTLQVEPVKHDRYKVETGYPQYNTDESTAKEALPSSGVVIRTDLTNIFINNIADDIPITGINGSGHNWIIYILAAFAGLAAIGAGIFLWKKRNEFVEE